ncbi:hypothetical protein BH10BDE1_BH10BDE1_15190 [soil metagenome]
MKFVVLVFAMAFGALILNRESARAYLPKGIDTEITIFNKTSETVTGVSIDGCDKEPCQRPSSTSICLKTAPSKWSCDLEEKQVAIRFKVRTSNGSNTPRTSDYQKTNGEMVPNFAAHVEATSFDLVALRDVVVGVNMQDMLENVWDVDTVAQLRAAKPHGDHWSDIKSAQIFEMTFCESQGCKEGEIKSVPCNFVAKGIRAMSFNCKIEPFARFAKIKFGAKDKTRTSDVFPIDSRVRVDLTAADELKVRKD